MQRVPQSNHAARQRDFDTGTLVVSDWYWAQQLLEQEQYMSMVICFGCAAYVDSDYDPDCFEEQPHGGTRVYCDACREERAQENDDGT